MDTVTEQAWRIGTCIQKIRSEETDETRAQRLICLRFSHTTYTLSLVELENLLEMAHLLKSYHREYIQLSTG